MPKIVDHDQLRRTIAEKAIPVFVAKGFSGVGMREIAAGMKVTKSALYHYFPSKEALFAAAGKIATARMAEAFKPPLSQSPTKGEKIDALVFGTKELDLVFKSEILLISDYLRHFDDKNDNQNEALEQSDRNFLDAIAKITGEDLARQVIYFCFGFLLHRMISNQAASFDELESGLERLLS